MVRKVILYSVILILGLFLLEFLRRKYIFGELSIDLYIGIVAAIFLGIGFVLFRYQSSETPENSEPQLLQLDLLSKREKEVLTLMAAGLSNAEIADQLHVSVSTVKTHAYRIFKKLNVKRRTQAIALAKSQNL